MKRKDVDDSIEVFAGSALDAGMVRTLLEDAEIETFLIDEIMGTLAPWYVSPGGVGAVKIIIHARDYDRAKPIVEKFELGQSESGRSTN